MAESETDAALGLGDRRMRRWAAFVRAGVTVPRIVRATRELIEEKQTAGTWSRDYDRHLLAAEIAGRLLDDQQLAAKLKAEAGDGWEDFFTQLIAFIEAVLPIVLQLLQIFAVI